MNLHPKDVLIAMANTHALGLGLVHGALDLAIQRSCASWTDGYPDVRKVTGGVLAGDIRQWLLHYVGCLDFRKSGLVAAEGPNCSVVLSDTDGEVATVRKHPRNYLTGELTQVTEIPPTLFGIDFAQMLWRPYVLWDPDLQRQVLRKAWLAAVAGIDDPAGATIFFKQELPTAIIPVIRPETQSDEDFWQDDFGEQEGDGSGSPA